MVGPPARIERALVLLVPGHDVDGPRVRTGPTVGAAPRTSGGSERRGGRSARSSGDGAARTRGTPRGMTADPGEGARRREEAADRRLVRGGPSRRRRRERRARPGLDEGQVQAPERRRQPGEDEARAKARRDARAARGARRGARGRSSARSSTTSSRNTRGDSGTSLPSRPRLLDGRRRRRLLAAERRGPDASRRRRRFRLERVRGARLRPGRASGDTRRVRPGARRVRRLLRERLLRRLTTSSATPAPASAPTRRQSATVSRADCEDCVALGIPPGVELDEASLRGYLREKAKVWHPDRHPGGEKSRRREGVQAVLLRV